MKRLIIIALLMIVVSVVPVRGEAQMVEDGKTVTFDYTLTVDGQVADTSEGKDPLSYVQGRQMIIPGLENQIAGMKPGEEKQVVVQPEDAYGTPDPQAVVEVPKERLDPSVEPQVGMVLQLQAENGQALPGIIEEVKDDTVTINFNHPLSGKELTFDVKILDVKDTPEEPEETEAVEPEEE